MTSPLDGPEGFTSIKYFPYFQATFSRKIYELYWNLVWIVEEEGNHTDHEISEHERTSFYLFK